MEKIQDVAVIYDILDRKYKEDHSIPVPPREISVDLYCEFDLVAALISVYIEQEQIKQYREENVPPVDVAFQ